MCRVIIGPCDACCGEGKIAVQWPGGAHEFVGKCETCNGEGWMLDVVAQCDGQQHMPLISTERWWEIFSEDAPWP
jgi:hypothetical protein